MTGRQIRAYLPATFATLRTMRVRRELPAGEAYTVTAALRGAMPDEDLEILEYEAFSRAAEASLLRLRAEPDPPRRVVIAVDIPAAQVAEPAPEGDPAAVTLTGLVPLTRVAAIHVDGEAAQSAVAGVLAAPDPAGVELDDELAWYDGSELGQLVPDEAG